MLHIDIDLLLPTRGSRSISRPQLLEHTCTEDMTRNVRVVGARSSAEAAETTVMCAKVRESARESVLAIFRHKIAKAATATTC
jgi:hypothetical protein